MCVYNTMLSNLLTVYTISYKFYYNDDMTVLLYYYAQRVAFIIYFKASIVQKKNTTSSTMNGKLCIIRTLHIFCFMYIMHT